MIFKQLFEDLSSTYTYLLASEETRRAVLVDPVMPTWQRDLEVLRDLGLTLAFTVETHLHADHVTSAKLLAREVGSRIAGPANDGLECTQLPLEEGKPLVVDDIVVEPLHTPGHTDNHFAYVVGGRVLTGDALLIDGCGRTDFQNGDSARLYESVAKKLFTLSEDTLVYPGHDYHGRRVSSIAQEKGRNPRLGGGRSLEEFIQIMKDLKLPYPKFMDYAVPANRGCGECPEDLPRHLEKYCGQMRNSLQG